MILRQLWTPSFSGRLGAAGGPRLGGRPAAGAGSLRLISNARAVEFKFELLNTRPRVRAARGPPTGSVPLGGGSARAAPATAYFLAFKLAGAPPAISSFGVHGHHHWSLTDSSCRNSPVRAMLGQDQALCIAPCDGEARGKLRRATRRNTEMEEDDRTPIGDIK